MCCITRYVIKHFYEEGCKRRGLITRRCPFSGPFCVCGLDRGGVGVQCPDPVIPSMWGREGGREGQAGRLIVFVATLIPADSKHKHARAPYASRRFLLRRFIILRDFSFPSWLEEVSVLFLLSLLCILG